MDAYVSTAADRDTKGWCGLLPWDQARTHMSMTLRFEQLVKLVGRNVHWPPTAPILSRTCAKDVTFTTLIAL